MSTKDSILAKILVCMFCSETACGTACCYNTWTSCESCGLAQLNQQACCWTLCAPICHQCKLGDTTEAMIRCSLCFKFCIFATALNFVAPCDGCYACIFYNVQNCTEGVSGFKDILKHTMWLGKKVEKCLELKTSNEPEKTYGEFKPWSFIHSSFIFGISIQTLNQVN